MVEQNGLFGGYFIDLGEYLLSTNKPFTTCPIKEPNLNLKTL
jgi:hypothetical protein